ncbi:MAG TPA: glycosyltransferase family 39 protein [Chloroflexia bacterium]|nr:glycosyltransferase family 39 protein [Chloroflexia bacterium]
MKSEVLLKSRPLLITSWQSALVITLAGLLLRLIGLGSRPLWFDETISAVYAHQDIPTLLQLNAGDNHPPGYYLALKAWITLFGSSDAVVRLLSVWPGVVSIWLVWVIGKRLFPARPGIALAATALTALSPFQVYFSQEARNYSFLELFVLLAFYCWLLGLEENRWWQWLGLAIAGTLGLFCNFTTAFYLAALGFYPFIQFKLYWQRGVLQRLVLTGALTGLFSGILLLPKLTSRLDTIKGNFWIPQPDPLIILRTFYTFIFGAIQAERFVLAFGLALVILIITAAQVIPPLLRGKNAAGLRIAAWMLVTPLGLITVVSLLFQPLYLDKALIACSPFYYLLIGWAIFNPQRQKSGGWLLAAVPVIVAILLALAALPELYTGIINPLYIARYDAPRINRYLNEQSQPGDIVVTATDISWLPLHYYNPGLIPPKYPIKEYPDPNIFPALIKQVGSEWLPEKQIGARTNRFWVVFEINRAEGDLATPPANTTLSTEPAWLHSPDWQRQTLAHFESQYRRLKAVMLDRILLVLYESKNP